MLGIALLPLATGQAWAQATVDLAAQKQYIRGFGGMVHIPWAGDLTAAERTLAFGNAEGQLGFTVLRIAVPDGSTSTNSYVATAKAAIAAGGIVFASPWNASGKMDTNSFATYADHLSSFVTYMKGQGADLYAISVQNEPDYAAQSGWREWSPEQCRDFMANYGDKLGTKAMSCESFQYRKALYDPTLNDPKALANLGVLGAHLYGTQVRDFPYPLFDQKAAPLGIERWMTEVYTDSNTDANQWPNALNVATNYHNSMVEAQFNAYVWWYIKRSYGPINNGAVTKRGWCMAQWSKFVRPGFYRVDATKSPKSGVSLSAYKSNTDVVIVAVNTGGATSVDISIKGSSISSFDKYTTSSSKNVASDGKVTASGGALTLALDGSSVTTIVGKASDIPPPTGGSGGGGSTGAGGATGAGGNTAVATSARPGGAVTGGTRTTSAGGAVAGGTTAPSSSSRVGGSSAAAGSSAVGGVSTASSSGRVGGSSSAAVASSSQAGTPAGGAGNGGQSSSAEAGASGSSAKAGNDGSSNSSNPVTTGDGGGGCNFVSGATPSGLMPFALTLAGLVGLLARRRRSR
jgi:glucuronoarabinoxylan endo-1,4-beta-xylanase